MGTKEADLLSVESAGEEIQRRRKRLGIDRQPFAHEAGVSATTLRKIEEGKVDPRDKSLAKIHAALDHLELEGSLGKGAPPPPVSPTGEPLVETIEFVVEGDFGVKVTVRGPITNREDLQAAATEIIRSIRAGRPEV